MPNALLSSARSAAVRKSRFSQASCSCPNTPTVALATKSSTPFRLVPPVTEVIGVAGKVSAVPVSALISERYAWSPPEVVSLIFGLRSYFSDPP